MTIAALALALVLAGSWVYCVLIVVAARKYRAERPRPLENTEPISILKPLAGLDLGLEENLRSFFTQDYPEFEVLMAVRSETDAAVPLVRRLQGEFSGIPSRLIFTGEPPYPNAKVFSLDHMMRAARCELLVMADSDIRAAGDLLRVAAAEFQDPKLGLATCPYRAVGGPSIWSKLEAIGMNTEFWGGVLVARMLEGVKFTVGPTVIGRKRAIEGAGGWDRVREFLAEDFVLGKFADEAGWKVILSSAVVEHRIGSEPWAKNAAHRIRWARSTRRSRPAGYIGQVFTNPLPIALLMTALRPDWWPLLVVTMVLRALAAQVVASSVLSAAVGWALLVWQDLLSFVFWILGFFGNTIDWRGRRYRLERDGRFTLIGE